MVKSNCHTHTLYCDGNNTVKEMIDSAVEKDFISLGFSGHSPMILKNDWAMTAESLKKYIDEVRGLKGEYKDKIDILCGIELDADYCDVDFSSLDYTIGSMHQFMRGEKDYPIDLSAEALENTVNELFKGSWIDMCREYFSCFADFICEVKPDIVGHFDLVTKYNENNRFFDEGSGEYQKAALEAVDRILSSKKDIIFEVNTGAMYRTGKKKPYPATFIMEYLCSRDVKITITSDSHCTDSLDFGFETACEYCRNLGFEKKSVLTSYGIIEVDL